MNILGRLAWGFVDVLWTMQLLSLSRATAALLGLSGTEECEQNEQESYTENDKNDEVLTMAVNSFDYMFTHTVLMARFLDRHGMPQVHFKYAELIL